MRTQATTLHHTGRKILHKFSALFLMAGFIAVPALGQENFFAGGSGTIDDPWHIETIEQLQHISEDLEAHYILIQDIDASVTSGWNNGAGFDPIGVYDGTHAGADNVSFMGTLDGDGHVISGLTINRPNEDGVGLFARTNKYAHIKNIQLENADVTGNARTGAVVGFNGGLIYQVGVSGSVMGGNDMGLISGVNALVIDQSQAYGEVTALNRAGGITGLNWGEVYDSEAHTEVYVHQAEAGGLAGVNTGLIRFSHASGTATAEQNVAGGLVATNNGEIQDSYATGDVLAVDQVGGLAGINGPGNSIINSHATGNVTGNIAVGGLVGFSDVYGTIQVSFADGDVTGEGAVGGLAGFMDGTIINSYARGNVNGGSEFGTGGLVGTFTPEGFSFFSMRPDESETPEINHIEEHALQEESDQAHEAQFNLFQKLILNSFAAGQVSGQNNVGGLVGENSNNDEITSSYWDVQTTQQTEGVGAGDAGDSEGLQTSQMSGNSAETYLQGFEFNEPGGWEMVSGSYPELIPDELDVDPPFDIDIQTHGFGDAGTEITAALVVLNTDDTPVLMNRTSWFSLQSEREATFYDNDGREIERIPIQRNGIIEYFSYVSFSGGLQEVTATYLMGQPTLEGAKATTEINIFDEVEDFIITGLPLIQAGRLSEAPYLLTIRNEEGYRSAPEEATTFSLSSTGEGIFYDHEDGGSEHVITELTVDDEQTEALFWYRNEEEGTHTITAEFLDGDQALSGKMAEIEVTAAYPQDDQLMASPNQATNNGTTTVMVYGSEFEEGTELQLVHASYEPITGTILEVINEGAIRVRFNIANQPEGTRTLRVTYPDGSVVESPDAFTITSGADEVPELWTHIQGWHQLQSGKTARININYGNNSSVDLYDMLLYIYLPSNLEFEIVENSIIRPGMADMMASPDYDGPENISEEALYYELENKTVIPLWIYQLSAETSQSIELNIKIPDSDIDQGFSEVFGRPIETEIAALPPEASPFTLSGDFDAHEPNMLIHFSTLIYVAALQEEGLIDSSAPFLKQAMNLSEIAGSPCNPGPPPPDLYTNNQNLQDEIQNHRRNVANQMREEATSLAPTPFSYGAGAA
ncbi:hypothetical protein QLX67_06695, partial [Balneolaceae bacterium ANBcel3]|nr:hypothetical protein [Balneolaceae bacterium ANBcel3]